MNVTQNDLKWGILIVSYLRNLFSGTYVDCSGILIL